MNLASAGAAEDPIVGQGDLGYIEDNPLRPVVQLAAKRHRQRDLPLRLAPSRVDPLKRARLLEVPIRDLQPLDHDRQDQVQNGPAID